MKIFEAQKGIDSIGRIMPLRDISLKNISLSFVKIVILSFSHSRLNGGLFLLVEILVYSIKCGM